MKVPKGEAGYINSIKKRLIIQTLISFGIVAIILLTGYLIHHTKLNMLTILAVLGCLPACRTLVNLIMVLPHHSIEKKKEMEIRAVSDELTILYDLIVTSEKKAMPIEAVAVSGNTVCGYSPSEKVDTAYAASHIKSILLQNKLDKVTVKIFHDYVAFLSRVEGMNSIASIDQSKGTRKEKEIAGIIMDISL